MKFPIVDYVLLIVIAVGCVVVLRSNAEKAEAHAEEQRLIRAAGMLRISDPSKVHILALETDDPQEFAWRVYLPANFHAVWRSDQLLARPASSGPSDATQFVARFRFREEEGQGIACGMSVKNLVSHQSIGDPTLGAFLRGRWDELEVTQLGVGGVAVLEPDAETVVLRIAMPAPMRKEAEAALSPQAQAESTPEVFEVRLGGAPTGAVLAIPPQGRPLRRIRTP